MRKKQRYLERIKYMDDTKIKELTFSPKINIIIGPKGGGKSLLLKILWALREKKHIKKVNEAFKNFKITDFEIKWSDSDQFEKNVVSDDCEYKWNDKKDIQNFLKQKDQFKEKLHKIKDVKEEKSKFFQQISEEKLKNLKQYFENTTNKLKKLPSIFEELNKIDWRKIYEHNKKFIQNKLINLISKDLLKKPEKIEDKIFEQLNEINKNLKNGIELSKKLNKEFEKISFFPLNFFDSKKKDKFLLQLEEIKKFFSFKKEKIEKYNKIVQFYVNSLNMIGKKLENSSDLNERITHNMTKSKNLFKNLAKNLFSISKDFKILKNNQSVKFKSQIPSKVIEGFSISIDYQIPFKEMDFIQKILSIYFFTPKKKKENWLSWAFDNKKKNKEKKWSNSKFQKSFEESLEKFLKDKNEQILHDLVDLKNENGENYADLSLGERSVIGIKKKLKNMQGFSCVFLDQLEDNLDNFSVQNTIVSKLKLLSENQQVFVVTHNANIGINTNSEKAIICNLQDEKKYEVLNIEKEFEEIQKESYESKLIRYLEGGKEALVLRCKKILKK